MNITPDEAAQALLQIENSKQAMRLAIRSHRGHVYLWIWGAAWILMSAMGWSGYAQSHPWSFCWVSAFGVLVTIAAFVLQGRVLRATFDRRFLGVCGALLVFSYVVWPLLLHSGRISFEAMYAYSQLVWIQLYIVGGILFSNHLLWVGLIVTVLLLGGLLLVPVLYWPACVLSGLTLVASGVFIKSSWRA
ncbi:MAG TPA: hypothetical protein VGG37_03310 [Opitutaceae bacterium]|jgi:hypothetical protein